MWLRRLWLGSNQLTSVSGAINRLRAFGCDVYTDANVSQT